MGRALIFEAYAKKKTSSPATAMVGDDCTELRFPSSS